MVVLVDISPQGPSYADLLVNIKSISGSNRKISVHLVNHHGRSAPLWSALINLSRYLSPSSLVLILPPALKHDIKFPRPQTPPLRPTLFVKALPESQSPFLNKTAFLPDGHAVLLHRDASFWCLEDSLVSMSDHRWQWEEFVLLIWLSSFGSIDFVSVDSSKQYENPKYTVSVRFSCD